MNTRESSNNNQRQSPSGPPDLPDDSDRGGEPECPKCGGLGYIVPDVGLEDPSFGRAILCSCRNSDLEVSRYERLKNLSEIGSLHDCTFGTFMVDGVGLPPTRQLNLKLVYQRALEYAHNPQGWLVFRGGYGCGKTHLAAAIANHRLSNAQPVLFINTPDLLDHLRAAYSPTAAVGFDERFQQVRRAPLLILDDLGTQSNTDWAQEKLYQIFNYRYNAQLPTVVTTNQELEHIEGRIRSRLVDHRLVRLLTRSAPDFRRAGFDETHPDLSTLDLHGDQLFETFTLRERELPKSESDNLHRAFKTAKSYSEDPREWLVLNSVAHGNGKTHLAASIANYLSKKGESVLFISVPDLLDHLRATFSPSSVIRYDRRFNEIRTAPYLILDDLGTESATPWAREKLYQLLNYRYNARLPTVITTSTPISKLDPRLESRMMDERRSTFFVIQAPSYRGKSAKRRPTRARRR